MLRVLYVGMRYDYGDPRRGDNYEYVNFLDTLQQMQGIEVAHFPYDVVLRQKGRAAMNRDLLAAVESMQPDVCFFVLFTDEIARETIERISGRTDIRTINWFTDDHWRFESYSRHWAPAFNFVMTTDALAAEKYRTYGIDTVIHTQWGFNPFRYRPQGGSCDGQVSFVGQVHSHRGDLVRHLESAGLSVSCWGLGWPNGRLPFDEMVKFFSRSAICLNFSESSVSLGWKPLVKVFLNRRADGTLHLHGVRRMGENAVTFFGAHQLQIKGRVFEIPGAGGFLLTEVADDLERYFVPDREIVTFQTPAEMVEKVRYYLAHGDERERIRAAGYERAVRDHSYVQRFLDIFRIVGVHEKIQ
jgi:spore maturation protein CgeB